MDSRSTRASRKHLHERLLPRWLLHAWLLACSLLLCACGEQAAKFQLTEDAVLLAFGDSITYGSGAVKQHSYPAILSRLSGHQVINAGLPGEVSAAGRLRLPGLLDEHQPSLLLLCHGGNDFLRRLDPLETKTNLAAMIESAKQRNIPVLLIGVPAFGLLFLDSADLYDELAQEHALLYAADVLPRVESDAALKSDRVHPNAAGYREIATAVYTLLVDSGALSAAK